jgi:hypothetical protein
MVYIGLPGESYQALDFSTQPVGEIRLPKAAVALRQEMDKAWMSAVMKGHVTAGELQKLLCFQFALPGSPEVDKA